MCKLFLGPVGHNKLCPLFAGFRKYQAFEFRHSFIVKLIHIHITTPGLLLKHTPFYPFFGLLPRGRCIEPLTVIQFTVRPEYHRMLYHFIFSYCNKLVYLIHQPLAALGMKRLIALAEITGNTILRKQVKDLSAGHSLSGTVFFNAERNEQGYIFVFTHFILYKNSKKSFISSKVISEIDTLNPNHQPDLQAGRLRKLLHYILGQNTAPERDR